MTLADPAGCCLTKFDATFNSDSGQLLTIDTSGALHAWDVPTQTLVLQNKPPDALQFARLTAATLTSNGERAAAGDSDGNVWLWDTRRGLMVGQRPAFGTSTSTTPVTVSSIALSADGQRIAAGSDDGRVDVWEAEGNKTLIIARQIHTGKVHSIAWNPSGTQLISVDDLGMAVLWNIDTGMPETLADSTIVRAAFSPDSSQIVTAENDGRIRLWNASTGRQLRRMEPFREIPIVGIAWNKDGRRIVGLWQNGTLAVFDASTGVVISQQSIRPGTLLEANQSWTLMFSPDSRRVLGVANDTKTINMWDIGLPRLHNRGGSVNGVSWSPDNRHIVIANEDGTAKIWDAATGLLERTLEGHQGAVTSTKWSPDGNLIATTGMDGTIRIWKATTGDLERTIEGHDGTVTSAAWSPDSTLILTGSADKTARVWNMIGIQVLSLDKHTGAVTGVAWSPDENTLATVGEDRLVLLWNASNGELLHPTSKALDASLRGAFSSPSDGALRVTFSADSQRLAIASGGSAAFIWNITADTVLRLDAGNTLSAGQNVSAAVFSPDGSHVLTAHWDGIPRLWRPPNSASADANATQPVLLSAHIGIVTDVSFSPDGQWIVTCGEDGVAQVQYGNFRRVLAVAQQRQTRKLTIEERIQYLGGDQQ
jgi:WD40 repeat protein